MTNNAGISSPTLVVEYAAPLRRAGRAASSQTVPLTMAVSADGRAGADWSAAVLADLGVHAQHEDAEHKDRAIEIHWGDAENSGTLHATAWSFPPAKDKFHSFTWGVGIPKDHGDYDAGWIMNPAFRDRVPFVRWYSVNLSGAVYDDNPQIRALLNTDSATTVTLFGDSGAITVEMPTNVQLRFGYRPPSRPSIPHDLTTRITARQATERDSRRALPWGAGESIWRNWNLPYPVEDNQAPDPDKPADPPEIRTVYVTMNTLQIIDVATSTPLNIRDVRISLDIDSLSWQFSGTLQGAGSLELVRPDGNGMKDISVTINTHAWVFTIERYTSDEQFPTHKFRIDGVSRTQYMAAPFAPSRSYTNAIATTAAQAATQELQGTGFTLAWPTTGGRDLPDWPVPVGALSFRDKSPAQVVAQIVKTAGGVMIPAQAADEWKIQPRYPVTPWNWSGATPDAIIYIGMVRSRSAQYEPAPAFDGCYVSGVNHGVAVEVQRQGTGGLNPMPDIFDELITDPQAAIARGKAELSAVGNKVVETLSLIIPESGAAPGIITPGQLVKVQHDNPAEDYLALCLSTSIAAQKAGGAEVYQSVTLERTA